MGPKAIKKDIYYVMTTSREMANYCQESVKSYKSKKISDSLNNFHLKPAIEFIINSLTCDDRLFFELNDIDFSNPQESREKQIYNKVIDYIESYLIQPNI